VRHAGVSAGLLLSTGHNGVAPCLEGLVARLTQFFLGLPAEATATSSADYIHSLDLGGPWNPLPGARRTYRPRRATP